MPVAVHRKFIDTRIGAASVVGALMCSTILTDRTLVMVMMLVLLEAVVDLSPL